MKGRSQVTIQRVFRSGWEGEMLVLVCCTFPLESELVSPSQDESCNVLLKERK